MMSQCVHRLILLKDMWRLEEFVSYDKIDNT